MLIPSRFARCIVLRRYGPLFFVVFIYNTVVIPGFHCCFKEKTKDQVWFFKVTGCILYFAALLWIAPVAILALLFSICVPSIRSQVVSLPFLCTRA